MNSMDWSDLRYALALARGGTLSGAARELRVNHVTIGRRVQRLEEELGVELFDKTPDGYRITPAGELVMQEAGEVQRRLLDLRVRLEQYTAPLSGPVRISALDSFFAEGLQPYLAAFRDRYPDIELTLLGAAGYSDLARKQADIAIRTPRPKQPNLICRRAFKVGNAMYASRRYIERFGLPDDLRHAEGHFVVRYSAELAWIPEEKWIQRNVRGARIGARASTEQMLLQFVQNGLGVGFLDCHAGDRDPELTRLPSSPILSFTYWLTVHEESLKSPRVRVVLDWLGDVARELAPTYAG